MLASQIPLKHMFKSGGQVFRRTTFRGTSEMIAADSRLPCIIAIEVASGDVRLIMRNNDVDPIPIEEQPW